MGESYDRDLKDIFTLQDEVIQRITSAMSVNLTAGEQARAWAEGTKSLEAYLKLLQGREYLRKGIGRALPWYGAWRRKRLPWIRSTQKPTCCWVRPTRVKCLSERAYPPRTRWRSHRINPKGPGHKWLAGRGAQQVRCALRVERAV